MCIQNKITEFGFLLQAQYAVVNCIECYGSRLMFEHILNSLSNTIPAPSNNFSSYARCDNINDFVALFRQVTKERESTEETVYLVSLQNKRIKWDHLCENP